MKQRDWIKAALIIGFLASGAVYGYKGYKECAFNHGDYVRGYMGMVCINQDK